METLLRHLLIEPHGKRLLTTSAAFWFFSARILVFVMAGAETFAWGYLGFLFGEGFVRWVAAAFTGAVIFLVVWMIDVSLITLDRASNQHTQEILGRASPSRKSLDFATFGLRIALLIGSLTITAPYLAQVVFNTDIRRFIDQEATTAIDKARQRLVVERAQTAERDGHLINEKRLRLEQEVAGKGLSGRYGEGPAATSMRADI